MSSDGDARDPFDAAFDLARAGDTDRLLALLAAGLPADHATGSGDSLLMLAAYHGRADTVRALIDAGAEVDRCNDRQQSPLAGAVFKHSEDVIAALLDAGADPDAGTPSARQTAAMLDRDTFD